MTTVDNSRQAMVILEEETPWLEPGGNRLTWWFLTINNYDNTDIPLLKEQNCKYIVFQTEIGPENGVPHIHALINYHNAISFSSMKKKFPRANLGKVKNLDKARKYCQKEDSWDGIRYERIKNEVKIDINTPGLISGKNKLPKKVLKKFEGLSRKQFLINEKRK